MTRAISPRHCADRHSAQPHEIPEHGSAPFQEAIDPIDLALLRIQRLLYYTQAVSAAVRGTKTLDPFDLFVTPTTPMPAFEHNGDIGGIDVVGGQRLPEPSLFFHRLTEPRAHAGLPCISVPCGFTSENLPVGLQFIASLSADVAVLRAAARYERTTGWSKSHPSL